MTPEKAITHRAVLVVGEEGLLRRRALEGMFAAAGVEKDDFDLQTFEAEESAPDHWAASAGTAPFLAERRTVVVRHVLRRDPDQVSAGTFLNLPASALLILVADDEGSETADRRAKSWAKVVEKEKGAVWNCDADPKKAAEAIRPELARLGKSMSPAAGALLLEMTGGSLSRATDELEKLALYVGDADRISEADVRAIVVPSREWNVFAMVDAILEGNVPEAIKNLRVLVGSATKAENAAHANIMPNLSRSLRLAWQARLCVDAGVSPGDAPAKVRACFPERPNLAKEPSWRQNRAMAAAKKTSLAGLADCLSILADTDARLKGALPGYSALDTLEQMVLEMAERLRRGRG